MQSNPTKAPVVWKCIHVHLEIMSSDRILRHALHARSVQYV